LLSAQPARASNLRSRVAFGLMAASGFAGLGYQIVWTQQAALWLGHEAAAVLAVVTAFFGGLAVGALVVGPFVERSTRPERRYAACEAVIALWSLALALLMPRVSGWVLDLTGAQPAAIWQWAVAFGGTFLLLLPATAAMGATLPAMERVVAKMHRQGPAIAALYACNTFGALLGVLTVAFWLVPEFGLARTAGVCAVFNVVCALVAPSLSSESASTLPTRRVARWPLVPLAATGLLGIAYEVLVVRVLSQVTEDTVYTFAILLAVYLVGTALGAAAYQRWLAAPATGPREPGLLRDRLLCLLAAACLLVAFGLPTLPVFYDQEGLLVRKLGIAAVPAIVSQEGKRLRIDELVVQ